MEPRTSQSLRRDLSAFSDGELGPDAARPVLEHLLAHPETLAALRQIQQLTSAADRAVRAQTPPPSDALRERLRQMTVPVAPSPARALRGPWHPLMGAIAALIVLAVGVWAGTRVPRATPPIAPIQADVLPASVVAHAEEIHGVCSRLARGLHTGGYPAEIASLADTVQRDLHSRHPYPDLTPIGYRYRGAGPCGWPLPDTAHLLYDAVRPGSVNTVSVFVQPWHGQYPLDLGRLYTVSVAQSPFPMLAWRSETVVYFLLADNEKVERDAEALIRSAPTTQPTPP